MEKMMRRRIKINEERVSAGANITINKRYTNHKTTAQFYQHKDTEKEH